MNVDTDRCVAFGLDPKEVRAIARRLSRAAMDAKKLGLVVFGSGTGTGLLRLASGGMAGDVAELDGHFDGGDGGDDY